ncbi:MAG: hypothetical protein U0105_16035 [Candidatus Obscuribacterales bacterium]
MPVQTQITRSEPDKVISLPGAGCSLWWRHTPGLDGAKLGFIGRFAADSATASTHILDYACDLLKENGVNLAVGPVDGNTWNSYRYTTWSSGQAPFCLEPQHPAQYPRYFQHAGFSPLATYYSSITHDLHSDRKVVAKLEEKLARAGVTIRQIDAANFDGELLKVFQLCEQSFNDNFLYTPITQAEFLQQYAAVKPLVQPPLVLLAERAGELVGFVFALPNVNDTERRTIIVKTLARLPQRELAGLGHLLLARVHEAAQQMGFKQAIHALMHQSNNSLALSNRYARKFREYALFARSL